MPDVGTCYPGRVVTVDDVRRLCLSLPRTTEHLVRDRVKFRVKQLVYVSFSRDETLMGFGLPARAAGRARRGPSPTKFRMPPASDLRYQWVVAVLAALDEAEMTELVTDAWTMVVPQYVAREHRRGRQAA